MHRHFYLASASYARRRLLEEAGIAPVLLEHRADESLGPEDRELETLVLRLARLKMAHLSFPVAKEGDEAFFLTADTLIRDEQGSIFGKPASREHAVAMLRAAGKGVQVGSGFCLVKARYHAGQWCEQESRCDYAGAELIFEVPEAFLARYLAKIPFLKVCGGIAIEGYGEQFVREIRGSYSAILGLPMCRVRERLQELSFYTHT